MSFEKYAGVGRRWEDGMWYTIDLINVGMGHGVLGKSLFLQDYIEKKKTDYQLDHRGKLCVLTKTNGSISHVSFNADAGFFADSLVIQFWEGSETEPLATVVEQTDPDGDARLVDTPLWDKFLQNLALTTDNAAGRDFIEFIQNHCFSGDLLWKDTDGNWVNKAIPLAVKMETLFEVVWQRRQLAQERLRQQGVDVDDDELELGDADMKILWPLLIPERRILITCAMGGWPFHKSWA